MSACALRHSRRRGKSRNFRFISIPNIVILCIDDKGYDAVVSGISCFGQYKGRTITAVHQIAPERFVVRCVAQEMAVDIMGINLAIRHGLDADKAVFYEPDCQTRKEEIEIRDDTMRSERMGLGVVRQFRRDIRRIKSVRHCLSNKVWPIGSVREIAIRGRKEVNIANRERRRGGSSEEEIDGIRSRAGVVVKALRKGV